MSMIMMNIRVRRATKRKTQAPEHSGTQNTLQQTPEATANDLHHMLQPHKATHYLNWASRGPDPGSPDDATPEPPPQRMQANRPRAPYLLPGQARAALQPPPLPPPHKTDPRGGKR